jgi:hypothetical protein
MDTTSDLTDCSRQRNLIAEGRRQSRAIGRAFRRLGIPVRTGRPPRGANTVLVTHGSALFDATGLNPEEGDAVVTAPRRGGRGYAVVSTVKVREWPRLASGQG